MVKEQQALSESEEEMNLKHNVYYGCSFSPEIVKWKSKRWKTKSTWVSLKSSPEQLWLPILKRR